MEEQEELPRSVSGGSGSGPGGAAAKRGHRTACNSCKRMKVKCEWDRESVCNRCFKHQAECIFTIPERKKREKKETYLTTLEDRLNRMEAVMAQSGLSMPGKEPVGKDGKLNPLPAEEDVGLQDIPDKMSLLKVFDDGTTLFIGASSGFSIFGHHGLKWVTEVTGSNDFAKVIMSIPSPQIHLPSIGPEIWERLPDDQYEPLPSREHAIVLINEFFNIFGGIFPLFSRPTFMTRFERSYPLSPSQDPAWYACLNIVFAIGSVIQNTHQFRDSPNSSSTASSPRSANLEDEVWWKWFRNSSAMYLDLQFKEGDICAVQAMVALAFILQTLPDQYPCSVVAGAALRLAQALGLHRNVGDAGLTEDQVEERRNVFWTALVIERAIIMRSGRPSIIHEDDIGIELPKAGNNSVLGPNLPRPIRYMATLSLLQGRIYNKLYSAKAATRSTLERLQWVSRLDEELQEWKDSLPIEIRPGNEMKVDKDFVIPVLMMHFGYLNALATIHRRSVHYKSWNSGTEPPLNTDAMNEMKLNPRVFSSGAITVGAARGVMSLLKQTEEHLDSSQLNIIRMLDYYPLSACLILFANVLQNPRDSQALSDVALMKNAIKFLSTAVNMEENTTSSLVLKIFKKVNDLTERFVKKSQSEGIQNPKRGRESLQTPNYVLEKSPFDTNPPSQTPTDTIFNQPAYTDTNTNTNNPSIPSPFTIQQTLPNQPQTTQQFLRDPLSSYTDTYPSADMTGLESLPLDGNVDFFPNDLLMPPSDGGWFFPLANLNPGAVPGSGLDGGMPRDTWMSTTGMGFGWSMGGGQNVDWGFGGGMGTGTGTGTGAGQQQDEKMRGERS